MDCAKTRKNFIFYIENKLSSEEEREMRSHLESCQQCSGLCNEISETYRTADFKEEVEPKAFFTESVMAKIYKKEKSYADDTNAFDILFSNIFRKVTYAGIALIVALVILFYVTEGTISFNFSSDNDELSTENVSTLFFDN